MIPEGQGPVIRGVLKYMEPHKVLQWAQQFVDARITQRDIDRLIRTMPRDSRFKPESADKPEYRSRLGGPMYDVGAISVPEAFAKALDRSIVKRARECGVTIDQYKRHALGWTVSEKFSPRRFAA